MTLSCLNTPEAFRDLVTLSCLNTPEAFQQRFGESDLLTRDPADYLWAAFNFWTIDLDPGPRNSELWTRMGTDYRTPELFHELLLANGSIGGWWMGKDDHSGAWFPEIADGRFQKAFVKEKTLLLRSEDFLDPELTTLATAKLSAFTDLEVEGFATAQLRAKTNVQFHLGSRGADNVVPRGEEPSGVYEISGFRPMLCQSRRLIYQSCRALCNALLSYNVEYMACVSENSTGCEPPRDREEIHGAYLELDANVGKAWWNGADYVAGAIVTSAAPFLCVGFWLGRRGRPILRSEREGGAAGR